MKRFKEIFISANGKKVIREYIRAHVFLYACLCTLVCGFTKKSLEIVRNLISNRILKRLRKKYKKFIKSFITDYSYSLTNNNSNIVWVCWLQGIENAPEIVRICYYSLKSKLNNKEIICITETNYKEYVSFPEYIIKKIDKGIITKTHLSDLIRLELLENYGGTWIDATVLCTGSNISDFIFDSPFFIYQISKPGLDGHAVRTSSWFITSCKKHPIIVLTKALLYEYWKKENYLIDYFLIHDMFELSIEAYPQEWKKVVPVSSSIPHLLLLRLKEEYDDGLWKEIKKMTPFHKLTYKFKNNDYYEMNREGTFYDVLLKKYIKQL